MNQKNKRQTDPGAIRWKPWHGVVAAGIVCLAAGMLRLMGRRWWCEGGSVIPWSGEIWSMHNSQHLADPYTFTHFLHGMAFWGLFALILGRWVGPAVRALFVLGTEAAWEVLENTDAVIEAYRESTMALNYYGDSVLNSVGDILACACGIVAARKLPLPASIALFVIVELLLLLWIRDSLLLNVLMLIWPIDAIKTWQTPPG